MKEKKKKEPAKKTVEEKPKNTVQDFKEQVDYATKAAQPIIDQALKLAEKHLDSNDRVAEELERLENTLSGKNFEEKHIGTIHIANGTNITINL